ncbi:MAG: PorV/PorQ family protein [candidate division KSB1 bacterium]|nr:PorV/PorQ family protein [candidate division KSB1 bacterium]
MKTQTRIFAKTRSVAVLIAAAGLLLTASSVRSQSGGADNSWGGVTDIFEYQVGARAMAMGGAYVSVAEDPFTLYWNPGALERVPSLSIGAYHTNLPLGTQYDYLAFVFPTLDYGTFSAGLLRLATSGVKIVDDNASILGERDYSRTLYLIGYGKSLWPWLSVGGSLKIETVNMPGYVVAGSIGGRNTESAVGADLGVSVVSPLETPVLGNWRVGINYQNAVKRTVQLADIRESTPSTFRFGFSRPFFFSNGRNHFLIAYEVDGSSAKNVPNYVHFGAEVGYHNTLMLRLGWNKRGNSSDGYGLTYGFGISQMGFQLDYSYWNGVDSFFGSSHRISISANIGRTRQQKLNDRQIAELRRIQEEAQRKYEQDRRNALYSGVTEAREYYQKGDFFRAYSSINKVLSLDPNGEDPDFDEARKLAERINLALDQQRRKDIESQIIRSQEEAQAKERQREVQEHYDKALAFFESEQFLQAIEECDLALAIDPNNETVKKLRNMADADLRRRIYDLIESAARSEKAGRTFEALQLFNQALPLARGNAEVETFVKGKIRTLEARLSYEDLLRRAVDYENRNQWKEAAEVYAQALKSQPNNADLQRRYREANARANATQMEMTPEVKELYTQGYRALRDKNYDEAISYYEKALEIQPLNKTILRALDHARAQKRRAAGGQNSGQ